MNDQRKNILVAGNWKMNNSLDESVQLANDIAHFVHDNPEILLADEFALFPPYVHIAHVGEKVNNMPVMMGGQDCSFENNGAHTGDVSAQMLQELGCEMVILGHSERRQNHGETNEAVSKKLVSAHENGLTTIVCIGETLEQREAGDAFEVVLTQLEESVPDGTDASKVVVAYEPVWAIGTGKVASIDNVRDMHSMIAGCLKEKLDNGASIRILYGGSVKPDNAKGLLEINHVDGFLVGGASLNAQSFIEIAKVATKEE